MGNQRALRFVFALLTGQTATLQTNGNFQAVRKGKNISLHKTEIAALLSQGVLSGGPSKVQASNLARNWVKRNLLNHDQYSGQHQYTNLDSQGNIRNLLEGPIANLCTTRKGANPFMENHHMLAAQKIQNLTQISQMVQRTTMSYDPTRTGDQQSASPAQQSMSDRSVDARNALYTCLSKLPADCAGVVLDVCGYQKGLQLVETERRWPRRSAKLLLRVGLEQVANHFGIAESATGAKTTKPEHWLQQNSRPRYV